ncbi:DUF2484 family protein [Profundibacterium mesophilum]|uniref:UDP-N-acetylmuramate--alanine ligase n=1 Tax=Profundibacterium mesophilum KAUST100406-0324 TaxID=1037889 RepID=A0A921NPI6_9RHOB|nr:DUF2484 family protein [Profundibacterium mesophilum]KAF0675457.1 hypothetical protein PMES_02348 [Profundibacterium mesophilum KAUST100406-0324]
MLPLVLALGWALAALAVIKLPARRQQAAGMMLLISGAALIGWTWWQFGGWEAATMAVGAISLSRNPIKHLERWTSSQMGATVEGSSR